ncbi:MAG: hypothetical protein AVDCRST_MAG30-4010 [uncultured Solirubrobacteraceae bacterium]|uniref:Uncharacterized protein n=1 Tax=uncultured Solirubrobacteraceae bacterium TaxID=1162706 RepID=A0A6J4TWI3_9ACTN|nr:MAG: hypothetical protein AVDCRST_MAG30-4010 [uncultured Solirubrobacteraceae bacterium]
MLRPRLGAADEALGQRAGELLDGGVARLAAIEARELAEDVLLLAGGLLELGGQRARHLDVGADRGGPRSAVAAAALGGDEVRVVRLVPGAPVAQLGARGGRGGEGVGHERPVGGQGVGARGARSRLDARPLAAARGARRPRRGARDDDQGLDPRPLLLGGERPQLVAHTAPRGAGLDVAHAPAARQVEVGAGPLLGLERRPVEDEPVVGGAEAVELVAPAAEHGVGVADARRPHEVRVRLRDADRERAVGLLDPRLARRGRRRELRRGLARGRRRLRARPLSRAL